MADTKRSALAELAEWLETISGLMPHFFVDEYVDKVKQAKRIVAELAEIEPGRILGGRFDINSLLNLETAYENCRVIAEEGGGNVA